MKDPIDRSDLEKIVRMALKEDIGRGDVTTSAVIQRDAKAAGSFIAKEKMVVAGLPVAREVFRILNPETRFTGKVRESAEVEKGSVIAEVRGKARAILSGERVALNFLQRLCGIATLTRMFVERAGKSSGIYDTRKTTPGLRMLEKYAVRAGGGRNHRAGLYDMVLIKDNHIDLAGGIVEAVSYARARYGRRFKIEVETRNIEEVEEALSAGADMIMLDNMDLSRIRRALKLINRRAQVEISGGVNLENIRRLAALSVERISVGMLTHSAKAMDISMKVKL